MIVLIPAFRPDIRLARLVLDPHRADPSIQTFVIDEGSGPNCAVYFDAARAPGDPHWLLKVPGDRYEYELSTLLKTAESGLTCPRHTPMPAPPPSASASPVSSRAAQGPHCSDSGGCSRAGRPPGLRPPLDCARSAAEGEI